MWCINCNKRFPGECTCADRDDRLAKLSSGPVPLVKGGQGKHGEEVRGDAWACFRFLSVIFTVAALIEAARAIGGGW